MILYLHLLVRVGVMKLKDPQQCGSFSENITWRFVLDSVASPPATRLSRS